MTEWPRLTSASAAAQPAGPPPMMATSSCIEIWFLLEMVAVLHGNEFQSRPILLHLIKAFKIVERVGVGGIFCALIKLADPPVALGTAGQENVVGSLGGPPHEEILLATGALFALLVTVVKVCLPGQSHLLTEKAGAKAERPYLDWLRFRSSSGSR